MGKDKRIVPMSCKSTFCLRCGKVYVDDWVSQVSTQLHAGVIYRHIVLTMPEDLHHVFYNNSDELYGELFKSGAKCLNEFYSIIKRKKLTGGHIIVLQTHGRNGRYNPHLHIISTSGGLDKSSNKWHYFNYLPFEVLHQKWQWHLLELLKTKICKPEVRCLVDKMYRKSPNGFVANVQKGDVPLRYKSLAKYIAKYVVSPPISLKRIDGYDGRTVTSHYKSHETKQVEQEEVDVYTFIGRMIQHVFPKGFQRIRYYGVQATKSYAKYKKIIHEALLQVKNVVKGTIQIIAKKDYRARYRASTGKDPFECKCCGVEMSIWKIWHPKYGIIYDESAKIIRGEYEQNGEDNGRTVRTTAKVVQLPLPGL